jgi:predicted RNA-binding protein with PUA-like domain
MKHWLVKSEPDVYSIDDLERDEETGWEGVRNFQARNHLRAMALGDLVLFYHSSAEPSGVVGVAKVVKEAYPDPDPDEPEGRWSKVDIAFVEKLPRTVSLEELKADDALVDMEVTRKGSRLSVTEVSAEHFLHVLKMAKKKPATQAAGPRKSSKTASAARSAAPRSPSRARKPTKARS